jgi:endoglucanase
MRRSFPVWSAIRSLLVAACVASCGGGASSGASTPADTGSDTPTAMRNITSLELSKQMSPGWNLGNSLEALPTETSWGNPLTTQALMDAVKAAGFKTVRIPASWKAHADADDNIDAAWMARVKQVVDYAHNAGLYAIVNIHWDGGWMQPTYAQQTTANARLTKFWKQIATAFKDDDDHLLFAGTNEVMVDGDYGTPTTEYCTVQKGFNQTFVDAVRATGGNNAKRHLVVQAFNTNIDFATTCNATLPSDTAASRLFMEVHYYDPFDFTINDKSSIWQWGSIATDPAATETWANEPYVDVQFQKMKAAFIDKGVPVLLGEYGAMLRTEYDAAGTYRTYWDKVITKSAFQHGLVPVYWDNGYPDNHQMGLFDRASGAQAYPDVIAAIVGAAK